MKKSEATRDINYYLSLPYTTVLRADEGGDVVARVDELPGCIAHGKDNLEALKELESMKRLWIEDCLESGQEVPEPQPEAALPSGKWVQRVPRSLHSKLSRAAKKEGVSLNQLVTSILSERLGKREIEVAIEHMMAQYESHWRRIQAKPYWGFALSPQEPKHHWDVGTLIDCKDVPVRPIYGVDHWRSLENMLPTGLELKVEDAKTKPQGGFAHQGDFAHRR